MTLAPEEAEKQRQFELQKAHEKHKKQNEHGKRSLNWCARNRGYSAQKAKMRQSQIAAKLAACG